MSFKSTEYFNEQMEERLKDIRSEFIILNKITFHEDHARHLMYLNTSEDPKDKGLLLCQIDEIMKQNRHDTMLPYYHSMARVDTMSSSEDKTFSHQLGFLDLKKLKP